MRRPVVSEFVTVDGIFVDIGGGEAFDRAGPPTLRRVGTRPAGETLIPTYLPGRVA